MKFLNTLCFFAYLSMFIYHGDAVKSNDKSLPENASIAIKAEALKHRSLVSFFENASSDWKNSELYQALVDEDKPDIIHFYRDLLILSFEKSFVPTFTMQKQFVKNLTAHIVTSKEQIMRFIHEVSGNARSELIRWLDFGEHAFDEDFPHFLGESQRAYFSLLSTLSLPYYNQVSFPTIIHMMRRIYPLRHLDKVEYEEIWNALKKCLERNAYGDILSVVLHYSGKPRETIEYQNASDGMFYSMPILFNFPQLYYTNGVSSVITIAEELQQRGYKKDLSHLLRKNIILPKMVAKSTPHGVFLKCRKPYERLFNINTESEDEKTQLKQIKGIYSSLTKNCIERTQEDPRPMESRLLMSIVDKESQKWLADTKYNSEDMKDTFCPYQSIGALYNTHHFSQITGELKERFCKNVKRCISGEVRIFSWDILRSSYPAYQEIYARICLEEQSNIYTIGDDLKLAVSRNDIISFSKNLEKLRLTDQVERVRHNLFHAETTPVLWSHFIQQDDLFDTIAALETRDAYSTLTMLFESVTTKKEATSLIKKFIVFFALRRHPSVQNAEKMNQIAQKNQNNLKGNAPRIYSEFSSKIKSDYYNNMDEFEFGSKSYSSDHTLLSSCFDFPVDKSGDKLFECLRKGIDSLNTITVFEAISLVIYKFSTDDDSLSSGAIHSALHYFMNYKGGLVYLRHLFLKEQFNLLVEFFDIYLSKHKNDIAYPTALLYAALEPMSSKDITPITDEIIAHQNLVLNEKLVCYFKRIFPSLKKHYANLIASLN